MEPVRDRRLTSLHEVSRCLISESKPLDSHMQLLALISNSCRQCSVCIK